VAAGGGRVVQVAGDVLPALGLELGDEGVFDVVELVAH
jgi:hypothetical protein